MLGSYCRSHPAVTSHQIMHSPNVVGPQTACRDTLFRFSGQSFWQLYSFFSSISLTCIDHTCPTQLTTYRPENNNVRTLFIHIIWSEIDVTCSLDINKLSNSAPRAVGGFLGENLSNPLYICHRFYNHRYMRVAHDIKVSRTTKTVISQCLF